MFVWLLGEITESFNADKWFFEEDPTTGKKQKFWKIDDDCSVCGGPGFSCESINNCRYAPTQEELRILAEMRRR